MKNKEIVDLSVSAWREKVYIETSEHVIIGHIFMPKIGKKHRLLSEVLNTGKAFIAVKDCSLEYKNTHGRPIEQHEFIEVNLASILIMRPENE